MFIKLLEYQSHTANHARDKRDQLVVIVKSLAFSVQCLEGEAIETSQWRPPTPWPEGSLSPITEVRDAHEIRPL